MSTSSLDRAVNDRVPVLVYHSLTADATDRYRGFAIDPGRFREQMDAIAEAGYRTSTVGELLATRDSAEPGPGGRTVVLTFDDGFREVHGVVMPILAEKRLRATAYLVSAYIGGTSRWLAADGEADRPLMSWTEVRELAAAGVEIGAHGHRHLPLDLLPFEAADDEIVRSRRVLEDGLGQAVTSFAYPYGYHTGRIKRAILAAGYTNACGVKQAMSHPADDRLALARIIVYADTDPETFRGWLDGEGLPLGWQDERLATRAWRIVRRVRGRLDRTSPGALATDGAER